MKLRKKLKQVSYPTMTCISYSLFFQLLSCFAAFCVPKLLHWEAQMDKNKVWP